MGTVSIWRDNEQKPLVFRNARMEEDEARRRILVFDASGAKIADFRRDNISEWMVKEDEDGETQKNQATTGGRNP